MRSHHPRILLGVLVVATSLCPAVARATDPPVSFSSAPPTAILHDVRFGMNQAWHAPDAADSAGASWSRVMFWWSALQKDGPDDFDLFATDHDAYINAELARGRELVGAVINTPRWASADGTQNGVPKNLDLPWDHPDNHWGRFMRRLADHYRGRIDSWIIWSEVDVRDGAWQTWHGTDEEYVELLRVAYRAVKAANPEATVLPYGSAWWHDRGAGLTRMLDILAADDEAWMEGYYFDAANLHLYSRADNIPHVISWYRAGLAARGMEKPIWVTESNAIPYDDPTRPTGKAEFRVSLDEQASYIVQAFATYLGLGITRVAVDRALDGHEFEAGGDPLGLIRNDGSPRPAYTAFEVATRYFADAETAAYLPTDEWGLTSVVLRKADQRVVVAWNMHATPLRATLKAVAPRALRVTKFGETDVLVARDGQYAFDLAPATANSTGCDPDEYVVGGDPVILVERLDGDLNAAPQPPDPAPVGVDLERAALDVARASGGRELRRC